MNSFVAMKPVLKPLRRKQPNNPFKGKVRCIYSLSLAHQALLLEMSSAAGQNATRIVEDAIYFLCDAVFPDVREGMLAKPEYRKAVEHAKQQLSRNPNVNSPALRKERAADAAEIVAAYKIFNPDSTEKP